MSVARNNFWKKQFLLLIVLSGLLFFINTVFANEAAPVFSTTGTSVNTRSFSITGTADADATSVSLFRGENTSPANLVGTTTVTGTGWSIPVMLGDDDLDGTYTFTATATDAVGNSSDPSTVTITLDTTPPDKPTINLPSRFATSTSSVTISGMADASSTITLTQNGSALSPTEMAGDDGNWSINVTLTDGDNRFTATATDAIGNPSVSSDEITITLDTMAPNPPTINIPAPTFTNTNSFRITGTTRAGAGKASITSVELFRDTGTTSLGTITVTNNAWSMDVTLTDGTNTFTATATNAVGNKSIVPSNAVTITLDMIAPATPIVTSDYSTKQRLANISGTTEAGTSVYVHVYDASSGTVGERITNMAFFPDGVGTTRWTFGISLTAEGANTFVAIAEDQAGNESTPSRVVTITRDTTRPNPPTIIPPTTPINTNTTTISGRAAASSTITLTRNHVALSSTMADGDGNWSIDVTLTNGDNRFIVRAVNALGSRSDPSMVVITLDTERPTIVSIAASFGGTNFSSGETVSATTLNYRVTFNEAVIGFDSDDITVTGTAGITAVSSFVPVSATEYDFEVVPGNTDGTVIINIAAGVATDTAGNSNILADTHTLNFYVNETPTITTSALEVAENAVNGTSVGTITATDLDDTAPFNVLTFSITNGNTNDAFAINTSTGEITVNDASQLDYETTPTYSLTVQVADGGVPPLSNTAIVTITVTDVNEAPTSVSLTPSSASLPMQTDTTTPIELATIIIADDALGTNNIALSGDDVAEFETGESAGEPKLYLQAGTSLSLGSLSVTITVMDSTVAGSNPVAVDFVLTIVASDTTITFTPTDASGLALTEGATSPLSGAYALTDADSTGDGLASITGAGAAMSTGSAPATVAGTYGALVLTGTNYVYTLNNTDPDTLALADGGTATETFVFASSEGVTANLAFTITGVDTAATFAGDLTGTITEDASSNTVMGTVTNTDVDNTNNVFAVDSGTTSYGTYTITVGGAWTYTLDNDNATVTALNVGDAPLTDTFLIASEGGSTQTIMITINGADDAATIGGTTTATISRTTASVNGQLTSIDVDNTDDFMVVASAMDSSEGYGTYAITAGGLWTYTLHQNNAEVMALSGSATLTDTFMVSSQGGNAQTITITIEASATPTFGGVLAGMITEDASPNTVMGTATNADADNTDNRFIAVDSAMASDNAYGTYTITTGGVWTYTLDNDNATVTALNSGATLPDTFTIQSEDGSTQTITITINGANDAAVIGGTITATISRTTASVNGQLTSADDDNTNDFMMVASAMDSSEGYGTYAITAGGSWIYTLHQNNAEVMALSGSATLTDAFTVISQGGTSQEIRITITASANPTFGGDVSATITEDASSNTVMGTVTNTDVDNTNNVFAVDSGTTSYGTYTITVGGVWSYTLNQNHDEVRVLSGSDTLTDTFMIRSEDGSTQIITITINGDNDAPTARGKITPLVLRVNEQGNIRNVVGNFMDVDGDTLEYTAISSNTNTATVAIPSNIIAVTAAGAGMATITVTATDGGDKDGTNRRSVTQKFLVTVNAADAPVITASRRTVTVIVGEAITPITITSTGGVVNSYSIAPSLPIGLTLDTSTGTIMGTPSTVGSTTHTITAIGSGSGSANTEITLYVKTAGTATKTDTRTVTIASGMTLTVKVTTGGDATIQSFEVEAIVGNELIDLVNQAQGSNLPSESAVDFSMVTNAVVEAGTTPLVENTVVDIRVNDSACTDVAPCEITLSYADADLQGNSADDLYIFHHNGTKWEALELVGRDIADNTVTARATRFSPFAIGFVETRGGVAGINNLNAEILPRLIQAMVASTAASVENRLDTAFSGGGGGQTIG